MNDAAKRLFRAGWRRGGGALLILALCPGLAGCRIFAPHRPPGPDLVTPPLVDDPIDPVAIANRIVTSLLVKSPLNDFSRTHRVEMVAGAGMQEASTKLLWAALRYKLDHEDHIREALPPADFTLKVWVEKAAAPGPPTLRAQLAAGKDVRWRYHQLLRSPPTAK